MMGWGEEKTYHTRFVRWGGLRCSVRREGRVLGGAGAVVHGSADEPIRIWGRSPRSIRIHDRFDLNEKRINLPFSNGNEWCNATQYYLRYML